MYTCAYVADHSRFHCLLSSALLCQGSQPGQCLCTQLSRSVTCEHLACSYSIPRPLVNDAASVTEDQQRCPPDKTCLFLHALHVKGTWPPNTLHLDVAPAFVNCVCWPSPLASLSHMPPELFSLYIPCTGQSLLFASHTLFSFLQCTPV
jgi:hypothetical protein